MTAIDAGRDAARGVHKRACADCRAGQEPARRTARPHRSVTLPYRWPAILGQMRSTGSRLEVGSVQLQPADRTVVAWSMWLATFGCLAAGLVVAVAVVEPLTIGVLVGGAVDAVAFSLGLPPSGWSWRCGGRPTRSAGCMGPPASPRRGPLLPVRGWNSSSATAAAHGAWLAKQEIHALSATS